MISETHFRPGNKILYKGEEKTLTAGDFPCLKFSEVEGIPLTPGFIIARCGFKKLTESVWHKTYKNGWRSFQLTRGSGCFIYRVSDAEKRPVFDLHELQNLFFALTGEELKIQPA